MSRSRLRHLSAVRVTHLGTPKERIPHTARWSTERATDGRHRDGSIRDKNVVGFEKSARLNVEKGYNRRGNLPLGVKPRRPRMAPYEKISSFNLQTGCCGSSAFLQCTAARSARQRGGHNTPGGISHTWLADWLRSPLHPIAPW